MAFLCRVTSSCVTIRPDAIALAVAVAFQAAPALAGPQGGAVKAGSAAIIPNGANRLDVVQSSQRAVIDWRSFSIGAGEHVNFVQPSATAATLNRVVGADPSAILGRLTANGTVFLINPNGILIGTGAKIDVGSLVAATANLSNENFMAGRYRFDQVANRDAVIVNRGEITAASGGLVALVAPGVENSGVIRAQLGRVALASGNAFTLDLFGDKLVSFAVDDKVAARLTDAAGRPLAAYVNQTGVVEAEGGSVLIAANAAKAVLDNVVNVSGVVRATSFENRSGVIVLHGGDEGAVRVAGTFDASGKASGQTGGRVDVLGAEVALEPAGRIDASGDAGGGAVEVSGTRSLAFAGSVDVSARSGNHGSLLLDPEFLTVDAATANAIAGVLRTGVSEVRMAADTITVEQRIDGRGGVAGGGLRLEAGNAIKVDNDIITNGGSVHLKAGAGGIAMGLGPASSVTGGAGTLIHAGSAPITLEASGNIAVEHLVTAGEVRVRSTGGSVAFRRDLGGSLGDGIASLAATAAQALELKGVKTAGGVTVETLNPGGTIALEGPIVARGNVVIGDPDPVSAAETTIILRHDIHTQNADIELNGRTWINPRARADNVFFSGPFRRVSPGGPEHGNYYENPLVQVSLQTSGAGDVQLNGDVLWGGGSRPELRYIYNVPPPFPTFSRTNAAHVAALRAQQEARPTGYYGLNIGVEDGTVRFGGNVGMFNSAGTAEFVSARIGSLGGENLGNALSVKVNTKSLTQNGPSPDIRFAPGAQVFVGRFLVGNPSTPGLSCDVGSGCPASFAFASPPASFRRLDGGNLPRVAVDSPGPHLIGPSPRNVAETSGFAQLPDLPEVPAAQLAMPLAPTLGANHAQSDAALAGAREALMDLARHADPRRQGATTGAADVFGAEAPLVTFDGSPVAGADPDYFTRGPLEYAQSLAQRRQPSR
jgi:filamentous hemagglutinin family protein